MATASGLNDDAAACYSKANEAFVDEDYKTAAQFYTEAIKLDPLNSNYFACRSHALQKLEKHAESKCDATKAIELNPTNAKAYLRKGIACFNLGEYAEAKATFLQGQNIEDSGFRQWLVWCDEKLQRYASASQPPSLVSLPSVEKDVSQSSQAPQTMPAQPNKVKHDWYQTETHVCVTVLIKDLDPKNVQVNFSDNNVSMNAKLPSGSDFVFDVDLAYPIVPHQSSFTVLKTKVEIKLKKAEGIRWATLEGVPDTRVKAIPAATSSAAVPTYPSSSRKKKDWDKIEVEIKKEESEEKLEGEAALNQLFQKIYGEGSEEVRRAMNKSFMESGGTVLSTNWKEVAKDKVDVKPPDGMEYRKWES